MQGKQNSNQSGFWLLAVLAIVVLLVAGWLIVPRLSVDPIDDPDRSELAPHAELQPDPERAPASSRTAEDPPPDAGAPVIDSIVHSDNERVILQVLDENDRPIANAEVLFLEVVDDFMAFYDPYRKELPPLAADTDWSEARSLITEVDGTVILPSFEASARVQATFDDSFARRTVTARHFGRRVPLILRKDRSLEILVVDGTGTPVGGVPVGLYERLEMSRMAGEPLWRGTTGDDGIAAIPHAQSFDSGRMYASLAIPVSEAVEKDIEPTDLPDTPVRLVLPETGRMSIRVIGADEQTYPEATVFYLGARAPFNSETFSVRQTAPSGLLELPFVETGLSFQCSVSPLDDRYGATTEQIEGPAAGVEHEEAIIRLGPPLPVILAQLTGAGGTPLANRQFRFRFFASERDRSLNRMTGTGATDAQGRLRATVPEASVFVGARRPFDRIEFTIPEADDLDHGQPEFIGQAPFTMPEAGDEVDLGRVSMGQVPFLVGGRVITMAGVPVPGARVIVKNGVAEATADDNGEFRIFQLAEGLPREIRAFRRGHRVKGKAVPFSPGDDGVEIVLYRSTSIIGRLVLPAGILLYVDIKVTLPERERNHGTEDGYFNLIVPEGPVSLAFILPGETEPVHSIGPIEIEKGAVNDIGDIDLRPMLTILRPRIVDNTGEPVIQAAIYHEGEEPLGSTNDNGEIVIVSSREAILARIRAPGFGTVTQVIDAATDEVVLARGSEVEIRLTADSALPPEGYRMVCRVYKDDEPDGPGGAPIARTEPVDRPGIALRLSPGVHTGQWYVLQSGRRGRRQHGVGRAFEFMVEAGAPRLMIERTISEQEMTAALERGR